MAERVPSDFRPNDAPRSPGKPPQRGGGKMTAEIAIINKSAVALATDSAVTISTGSRQEKIFDTADKLFELCDHNPIGIMIYNGMSYAETPLPSLIKVFRKKSRGFDKVETAARAFLDFLQEYGKSAPEAVKNRCLIQIIAPPLRKIRQDATKDFEKELQEFVKSHKNADGKEILAFSNKILVRVVDEYIKIIKVQEDASFIGGSFKLSKAQTDHINKFIDDTFRGAPAPAKKKLFTVAELLLKKSVMSDGVTGIVIAGFGQDDMFPTLVSYEIDGIIGDKLKYVQTNHVDIDITDNSSRATVIPFAQKEMVERFLYGLDEKIQTDISAFCDNTVSAIATKVLEKIEFATDADKAAMQAVIDDAETAFSEGLKTQAFEVIRTRSRRQIEDMVEFMPKPELADMAEALVNLTSIKRRVSRGMETVGGPIDVAIISHSEGFVWVRRKHYFPADLNSRYFRRVRRSMREKMGTSDA